MRLSDIIGAPADFFDWASTQFYNYKERVEKVKDRIRSKREHKESFFDTSLKYARFPGLVITAGFGVLLTCSLKYLSEVLEGENELY